MVKKRSAYLTAALMAASCLLQAESGTWGAQVGLAQPSGGAKLWLGSTTGTSLDVTETYPLSEMDQVRMRFGFFTFKANSSTPQVVIQPGGATVACDAQTTNELFNFSYGAEYLRILPGKVYVLGGLGVNYVTASRKGTFDFTPAGGAITGSHYSTNNFVPYVTLGLGYPVTRNVALEARWQTTSMKGQNRRFDFDAPGLAVVDKMSVTALTLGLNITF